MPRNSLNKSFVAPSQDTIASTRTSYQPLNAPSQHFSVLSLSQIFAIPVHDASLPPPPGYLDCGNLQHIRDSTPPKPDSTDDIDMLISFLQSNIIHDKGYTWGDATEVVRWLFGELTKRLNHFLDLKVAELPGGQEPPELVRDMKGVSRDMRALVMWSRRRSHRQEYVDFRGFDEDVERWKLLDTSYELGVHDMVVLISEVKYRADFPGRSWMSLENLNVVAQPTLRPLARKKDAENHVSVPENHQESTQGVYVPPGFSQTRSGATQNTSSGTYRPILPARKTRQSRIQIFRDSSEQIQPSGSVSEAEMDAQSNDMHPHQNRPWTSGVLTGKASNSYGDTTSPLTPLQRTIFGNLLPEVQTMKLDNQTSIFLIDPRLLNSAVDNVVDFDPHSDAVKQIEHKSSSNKPKSFASNAEPTSKRQKACSTSRAEASLPSTALLPEDQDPLLGPRHLVHEHNFGSFSSFDSCQS